MSYLLRVSVPDRPGMLGALAGSLGAVGADIVSIDVVERSGGEAIDDIVIDLPGGGLPDGLITAAQSIDGVTVSRCDHSPARWTPIASRPWSTPWQARGPPSDNCWLTNCRASSGPAGL